MAEKNFRQYQGAMAFFVKTIGAVACLFFLMRIAGIFSYFNIVFLSNQYNAIFLSVVLTLTFLLIPASKDSPKNRLPWYDLLFIIGSLVGCIYIIANALELAYFGKLSATRVEIFLGFIVIIAIMEAVRRSFGWAMNIIVIIFILYTKFGYLIPGSLKVFYFDWSSLCADIYLSGDGIYGSLTNLASGVILSFIVFGAFFTAAGGGKFFMDLALSLTGSMRGGPAKGAILGSAMFGSLSGSPSANVVVTGTITIPMMIRSGFAPYYAAAIETIASTGGGIAPPVMAGIAFVMAQIIGVPYTKIAAIAAFPAILYFVSLYVQVHFQACKKGLKGLPRDQLPSALEVLKKGWEFLIPFGVLIVLMFKMGYPPTISAVYAIVAVIVVSFFRKEHRITPRRFIDSLERGLHNTLAVANILALAGIILALLTVTGLGPKLSAWLVMVAGGNKILLILYAGIASYILGMGVSWVAAYVLVSTLVAPALMNLGLPVIVTHFFIMYIVLSGGFTPPYCQTAYVAGALAKAHPFKVGFQAMRLGIVAFIVPFIAVFHPALLLIGTPGEIALTFVKTTIGILGLAAGIEGFMWSRMGIPQRVLFLSGGGLLIIPGLKPNLVSIVLLAFGVFLQFQSVRNKTGLSSERAGVAGPGGQGSG